jgi:branched-chain amino acid transport system substrate-binding protein
VIKQLENLKVSAEARMQHHDAYMNPNTHQMQQTIYLASANPDDKENPNALFKIVGNSDPDSVKDAGADAAGKLESFEDTPVTNP